MIQRVTFHRFKKFRDKTFDIRPSVVLLAGGNNSGKTTLIQGLAIWEFCKTVLEMEKGKRSLCSGANHQGVGLSDDEFLPINLPSLKHLWTNLNNQKNQELDGYTLWINVEWIRPDGQDRHLRLGLSLANDRLFIKALSSNCNEDDEIPSIAYVPPFAGIVDKEQIHTKAIRRRLIGQGLSGSIIRNLLLDMYEKNLNERERLKGDRSKIRGSDLQKLRENDPWEILLAIMENTFKTSLTVTAFNQVYHSYIKIHTFKGEVRNNRFLKFPDYNPRDLMVEGSGFLQWLSVISLALDPGVKVILLDEPDAHLHPSLQRVLVDELEKIANKLNKQVLFATHSPELIKGYQPANILSFAGTSPRYLQEEQQKIAMLAGIGSEYSPKLNKLQQYRKLIFVENQSDYNLIKSFAEILGRQLPQNIVVWATTDGQKERKILFNYLIENIQDLICISLRDRDDESLGTANLNLSDSTHPDLVGRSLYCRKWRRRYIEGYLLSSSAIARASRVDESQVINHIRQNFAIDISNNFVSQDEPEAILDARAKTIMTEHDNSIENYFNVTKYEICKNFHVDEIPRDIVLFMDELIARLS